MSERETMTTPNFTPDFTKTGDVFVDRVGNEYRKPTPREDSKTWPWWLRLCDGTARCYTNSGSYNAFANGEHDLDLVRQYTPTPAPQGVEVPQECNSPWMNNGPRADFVFDSVGCCVAKCNSPTNARLIIEAVNARHAPQPEALDMMSNGKAIEVSGIMLRRSGDYAIVEAEVDGKWKEVIREYIDAPFSHIVEPAGIADAKESELNSVPDGVEATPAPAATDVGEVRYACSKLAALGDTVKFLRIDDGLRLKVVKVRDDGMCELEYFDGGFFGTVYANQLEFVPEIPPATTPKYDGLPEFPTPAQRIEDALPYFREWLTNPEGTDGCYMECLHSGEIVAHFSDMNDALAFQAMAAAYEKAIGLLERVESPPDMNWFKELWSLTGEHMVLTEEGWIPAECNTREHTGSDPADVLDEVNKPIETDAAGNALSNSPETDEQRASRILGDPMRRVEMNTRDETPAHPVCRGCNQPLKAENAWMSDGCPCNNPRGINHGLVPKECCTCDQCDPAQTGSTRKPTTSQPIEQQQASDYDLDLGGGEENLRSQLVALDKMHRDLLKKQLPQQQASGVERYYAETVAANPMGGELGHFVKAADHDRIVAERDAEIAELRKDVERLQDAFDETERKRINEYNNLGLRGGEYKKLHSMLVAEQKEHERTAMERNELEKTASRLLNACSMQQNEIQQILGKALGYPKYADDQKNFPGATGDDVCVGDHVAESLASEIADRLAAANERVAAVEKERDGLRELLGEALSVLRGEWSILGMVACAEKIRSELNKQALAKPSAEVGE